MNKRTWGWMFFDWASQPYFTLLSTFIFAPYFASEVMTDSTLAQEYWGWMLAVVGILVAVLAPILGALADGTGSRTVWILVFSVFYVVGAFALWWAVPASESILWILVAFGIGMLGLEFATIFTNALLPSLGPGRDVGYISGSGWAFGYVGGLALLAIFLAFFIETETGTTRFGFPLPLGLDAEMHEGTRSVGPATALWYILFMIPFFLWVRSTEAATSARESIAGLVRTIRGLGRNRNLSAYLASSMFYRDALNGVYAFGGIYAIGVLGWTVDFVGIFGILGLTSGALFAWLGGIADRKYGPKPVILTSIIVLTIVCVLIVSISREVVLFIPIEAGSDLPDIMFFVCGIAIGGAGGMIQAASRTMMVRLANPERLTEAFGIYALAGKATAFLAPALIALTTGMFDSQRLGVSPLILLFLLGLVLLYWVRPNRQP